MSEDIRDDIMTSCQYNIKKDILTVFASIVTECGGFYSHVESLSGEEINSMFDTFQEIVSIMVEAAVGSVFTQLYEAGILQR